MKSEAFYENNLKGNNPQIEEFINQLFLSLEHDKLDDQLNEELIKKSYYNAYLLIFNSLKLLNSKNKDEINKYLLKAAETLETLSKLNHQKLNPEELIFDSMITYYISNNYPRAYVISKDNEEIKLPKYKESIFNFMNKDFHKLRNLILKEINSEDYDEDLLIEKLETDEIDEYDALEHMLSYSIFKSLNNVLNFLLLGDKSFIDESLELLSKYKNISSIHNFVDYWWTISVLEIIIKELYDNSLWNQLKPFYSDSDENLNNKLTNYIFNYANRKTPIVELWPSQVSAIPKILNNDENLTIKMPTSAGKTFIAELLILKYYMQGNFYNNGKVIYISPFKSLSNEVETSLKSSLSCLDLKISDFYGGFDSNEYEALFLDEMEILILTPEKFDVLLRTNPQLKEDIGLIIVDEGHIMGTYDEKLDKYSVRSTKFEFFMYRLKNLFKNSRIAFVSGVLSNIEDFSKWISGDTNSLIKTEWKPTNIYVGAIHWYKGDKGYIDYFYKNDIQFKHHIRFEFMQYFSKDCFSNRRRRKDIPNDDNEALALSAIEFAKEAPTYVYAPKKKETSSLAKAILKIINNLDIQCYNYNLKYYDENDKDISELKELIKQEIGENSKLLNYLEHGFIIHHADLPDRVKLSIENALRNRKINLVIATSTIVQGVNFPFKTIIFKGLYTPNLIDYSTFFNICGRAGRATEENNGRVLIFLGNIDEENKEEVEKIHEKFNKFEEFFSQDKYNLKSILHPLLEKIRIKHFLSRCTPEEFIFKLINELDITDIFDDEEKINIDALDAQLLAFIEEEDDESEILEKFINVTLYHVQNKKEIYQKYLKGFVESRLAFLKREFSENTTRSRAYNMGLSLKDCKHIENNYEDLKELFIRSKDWNNFKKYEKYDLLLNIALKMLELDTLYYDDEINRKNEILTSWIANTPILEIMKDDAMTELQLNKFINFCRNMIPWAITSILNFFRLKEPTLQIPAVCEYFSEMFKYGIFNLKIVILMPWANNNYEFCKKLSEYIGEEELNFNKLHTELELLYLKLQNEWDEKELEEFKKYLYPFTKEEEKLEIYLTLNEGVEITSEEFIYILDSPEDILLYDLNGNHIINVNHENIIINTDEKINIETIWKIKGIENNQIILESIEQ